MKTIKFFSTTLLLILISYNSFSQTFGWYLPWNNRIGSLEVAKPNESITLLKNGSNYRILKISNYSEKTLQNIDVVSKNSTAEVFYLPQISDYRRNSILDIMIPIKDGGIQLRNNDEYFLIKFSGRSPGSETVTLNILTDKSKYSLSKKISVSSIPVNDKLSLNVWAYFDYNFLVKNMKSKVITDLNNHNADVLVIPPFPLAVNNLRDAKIQALRNYISGTNGKFRYYLLSFGYKESSENVLSSDWKSKFIKWQSVVNGIFAEQKIPLDHVLFYPYDEPKNSSVGNIIAMRDWCRSVGINNPFFSTIASNGEAISLAKNIEFVQVSSKIVDKVASVKSSNTVMWIYDVIASSRNVSPSYYQNMGIKAYLYNASGIGVWNYADVSKAFASADKLRAFTLQGSWEMKIQNPVLDYSLIYRKNDSLYSSLRWEALSYGMQDNQFLNLYYKANGASKTKLMAQSLLNGRTTSAQWELIKSGLIQ